MRGGAGMGAVATGAAGMEATEAGGMGAEAMGGSGMEATGGEAHGWGSVLASGHTGGRIGGHTGADTGGDTGDRMPTPMPMPTRPSSPCHPPSSMCNPQHRPPPSPLHQRIGITATKHGGITPTCSNVQGDGGPSPLRHHKPEARGPRAHHPARLSSGPRCDRGLDTSSVGVEGGAAWEVRWLGLIS
jgi:hypothetical protein